VFGHQDGCPHWSLSAKVLGKRWANSWRTLHGHGSLGGEFQTCFIFNHRHGMMTPNTRIFLGRLDKLIGFLMGFLNFLRTKHHSQDGRSLLLCIRYKAMLLAIFNFLKRAIFNWVLLLLGVNKQLNEQYFLCSFYFQVSYVRLPWGTVIHSDLPYSNPMQPPKRYRKVILHCGSFGFHQSLSNGILRF